MTVKTEAVFTKLWMNNVWNVCSFIVVFKHMSCVTKSDQTEAVYIDRNEQWIKHNFSLKYEVCPESIDTESVFI